MKAYRESIDYMYSSNPQVITDYAEFAKVPESMVASAKAAFNEWRRVLPLDRAKILRRIAEILRHNANELAMIDAADCGNPVKEMVSDAMIAAAQVDFFAGFVTEMKGVSIPMGPTLLISQSANRWASSA